MRNLGLKYGTAGRNKTILIADILRIPRPAVKYQGEELRELYFKRTNKRLGKLSNAKLLREVRLALPGFRENKRDAVTGIKWIRYVNAMFDFRQNNKNMLELDFEFRYYSLKNDLNKVKKMNREDKLKLTEEWAFIKSMPQYGLRERKDDTDIEAVINKL
ncbi:uncharacterized protein LOC119070800 [Bradysia coprophila]|uniref:uncharacterized protein LOC119070800 n=1 Tax=Bradysia coprophila TaxID=38358 RepID=UPI00187D6EF0|nr:uncharacterized protein LOC119070800 [Bradysia coprophila]